MHSFPSEEFAGLIKFSGLSINLDNYHHDIKTWKTYKLSHNFLSVTIAQEQERIAFQVGETLKIVWLFLLSCVLCMHGELHLLNKKHQYHFRMNEFIWMF